MTAQVEKVGSSAYGLLKQEALNEFMHGTELSVENWIRNDAFADVATDESMQQVMLVIGLNRIAPKIVPDDQKKMFEALLSGTSRQLQIKAHFDSLRKLYAVRLLRHVFCAPHIYANVDAHVTDLDWVRVDDAIDELGSRGDWDECAFLIAMRYILHPAHPRPTEGQMNTIRERANGAFASMTNRGIYLFCLKLLEPENFPQVADDEWLEPFELAGVRKKEPEDFAFLLMAASDLELEGTMLKITPPSASYGALGTTAIPQPRHI